VNLRELLNNVSDIIFPPRCPACAEIINPPANRIFCSPCQEKIKFITGSICPVCGIPFLSSSAPSHICGNCLETKTYYSQARAVASFETVIMDTIHKFKYGRNIAVGETLCSLMAGFSFPDFEYPGDSLLIPVPLHIKKLRERGFNQSLLLANALGAEHKLRVNFSLLKRCKSTLTQTGLNKKAREENIKGAFIVTDKKMVAGSDIILIDDVFTTGATINECARTLLRAGAQKVTALTLARVLPNHA
jgi:ComF family protein